MGKPFIDRTGNKSGRLTVLRFLGKQPGKQKPYWECLCDCGNIVSVTGSNLATGHTNSCGCLFTETMEARRIYEKGHAPEYAIWRGIKSRVGQLTGKNAKWYSHIGMAPEWSESFHAFFEDMGPRPTTEHSIERKNNSEGYFPHNCVWATPQDQANNRSTNRLLTHLNETMTAAQWARKLNIPGSTIRARIDKYGWSIEDALTYPPNTGP